MRSVSLISISIMDNVTSIHTCIETCNPRCYTHLRCSCVSLRHRFISYSRTMIPSYYWLYMCSNNTSFIYTWCGKNRNESSVWPYKCVLTSSSSAVSCGGNSCFFFCVCVYNKSKCEVHCAWHKIGNVWIMHPFHLYFKTFSPWMHRRNTGGLLSCRRGENYISTPMTNTSTVLWLMPGVK